MSFPFLLMWFGLTIDRGGSVDGSDAHARPLPCLKRVKEIPQVSAVHRIAFSPDGKTLALASEHRVKVCDVATGKSVAICNHFGVDELAFSPSGEWLAFAGLDIAIWSRKRSLIRIIRNTEQFDELAWSRDGRLLIGAGAFGKVAGQVHVWAIPSGKTRFVLKGHIHRVTSIDVSPDGPYLASSDFAGNVMLWDLGTGCLTQRIRKGTGKLTPLVKGGISSTAFVDVVRFSPKGDALAILAFDLKLPTRIAVELWRPDKSGEWRKRIQFTSAKYRALSSDMEFSPDGRFVAVSARDGRGIVLDVMTGKAVAEFTHQCRHSEFGPFGGPNMTPSIAFSPDGRLLGSVFHDGTVVLWEVAVPKKCIRP